jgi:H+/Cl- antiporter ClcA
MSGPSPDPGTDLRGRNCGRLLVEAAFRGVPLSAAAYGLLAVLTSLQQWIFTGHPTELGLDGIPLWWPLPPLTLAGLLVRLTIRYRPARGGAGLKSTGPPSPIDLPGVMAVALASLSLGAVLGLEAPLITPGGGLAVCAVYLARRPTPPQITAVVAAAGAR